MKIVIIGHKNHGKGTFAHILREFGLTCMGTSQFATPFMLERLKDKVAYSTPAECYADRDRFRPEWYEGLREYNTPNPCQLIEDILAHNDAAEGLRHIDEYKPLRASGKVDLFIGIDASKRLPLESPKSMSLDVFKHADVILSNNDSQEQFEERARRFLTFLLAGKKHAN